jgi:DNA repair exonuclease SbcCD ATPase subunit
MVVKKIRCIGSLEQCIGVENENLDVLVELEDRYTYVVVVGTAKNIDYLMDKEKMNYSELGDPFIIVKKLTKEIIEETIKAHAEENDAYWLKFYHFAGRIKETVFDRLQAEDIVETLDTMSFNIGEELDKLNKLKAEDTEQLDKLKVEYKTELDNLEKLKGEYRKELEKLKAEDKKALDNLEKLKGEYRKELDNVDKLKSGYTELRKEFDELDELDELDEFDGLDEL